MPASDGSRSQSRSQSRSRSRSQSQSSSSSYSRSQTPTNRSSNKAKGKRRSRSQSNSSYRVNSSDGPRKKRNVNKEKQQPRVANRQNRGYMKQRSSSMAAAGTPRVQGHNREPVQRIMSANRLRIRELQNRVIELVEHLATAQQEKRDLQRTIRLQGQQINGYQLQENGMPQLVQRQVDETHMLREQLRHQKEKFEKKNKKLQEKEEELEAMRRLTKKMQSLIEDKKLKERKHLNDKLTLTEKRLEEETEKNKAVERHVQNLSKNHKHELANQRSKEQDLDRQLSKLQEKYDKLEVEMKEKEKERTLQNIYSNRAMKPPHRLTSSLNSSSQSDLRQTPKFQPDVTDSIRVEEQHPFIGRKDAAVGDQMEAHGHGKSNKKHEEPASISDLIKDEWFKEDWRVDLNHKEFQKPAVKQEDKKDKEIGSRVEKEMRKVDVPMMEVKHKENEQDTKAKEEARRRDELKKDEEERKKKQAEKKMVEEQIQKKHAELQQFEEKKDRYEIKPAKDDLEEKNNNDNVEDQILKENLLAKMRTIDEKKEPASSSIRKEYNFSEPVNNLHQGLPAHGRRQSNDSLTFGSYQPSFLLTDTKANKEKDNRGGGNRNKGSDLFADMFPEQKKTSNFSVSAKQDSPILHHEVNGSFGKIKSQSTQPTQLRREKQAIVPVFRSTANRIEDSDVEVEEYAM